MWFSCRNDSIRSHNELTMGVMVPAVKGAEDRGQVHYYSVTEDETHSPPSVDLKVDEKLI